MSLCHKTTGRVFVSTWYFVLPIFIRSSFSTKKHPVCLSQSIVSTSVRPPPATQYQRLNHPSDFHEIWFSPPLQTIVAWSNFRENRPVGCRTLFNGVNTFLSVLYTYCSYSTFCQYCTHTVVTVLSVSTLHILQLQCFLSVLYTYCSYSTFCHYCTHTALTVLSVSTLHILQLQYFLSVLYTYCSYSKGLQVGFECK
jgi:hypothetical protein